MSTIEFWARIGADYTRTIPPEVADRIEVEEPVRVVVVLPEPEEERGSKDLAANQFPHGYDASDDIYDGDHSSVSRPHHDSVRGAGHVWMPKVRDVLERLADNGWVLVATRGDHRQFKRPDRPGRVTIAGHPSDDIPPDTLNSI